MFKYSVYILLIYILFPFNLSSQAVNDSLLFSAFKYTHVGPTRGGRVTTVTGITDKPGKV